MKTKKRIFSFILGLLVMLSALAVPNYDVKAASISAPSAIYELSAKGTQIVVAWTPVQGAVKYAVKLKVYGSSAYLASSNNIQSNKIIIKSNPGLKYSIEVSSIASDGSQSYPAYKIIYAAPAKPKNVYLRGWEPGTSKPSVQWAGYYGNTTGALYPDGYQVQITTLSNKKIKTFTVKTTSFSDKQLSKIKNAGFKVKIRAYYTITNAKGPGKNLKVYSAWSGAKAFVPQPIMKAEYYRGDSNATFSWQPIKHAKSYGIYKVIQNGNNYKFVKYKTVAGSVTSTTVPLSLGKVTVLPVVKVGSKTYKSSTKDRMGFYGVNLQ
ncbi:MAG: hypothetical protein IKS48_03050 [Eubacterium sp.]|nr:hypothetical protein [Eubacterium sp.]